MMTLIGKRFVFEFISFFVFTGIYYNFFHKHEKWIKKSIGISIILSIIWTVLYCLDMVIFG